MFLKIFLRISITICIYLVPKYCDICRNKWYAINTDLFFWSGIISIKMYKDKLKKKLNNVIYYSKKFILLESKVFLFLRTSKTGMKKSLNQIWTIYLDKQLHSFALKMKIWYFLHIFLHNEQHSFTFYVIKMITFPFQNIRYQLHNLNT